MQEINKPYTNKRARGWLAIGIVVLLLIIDQVIKLLVKSNMWLGEQYWVTSWFCIDFVENIGMAYGMTFLNKIVLSLLRVVAVGFLGWFIYKVVSRPHRLGFVICLSMIMAGAIGNIFDSMFYGLVFTESTPFSVAETVPFGTGYAPFLYGKVVDMFYFPLINSTWPQWIPFVGGEDFVFFSPVFNFADSCISVGIVVLFIFFRGDLDEYLSKKKPEEESEE